MNTKLFALVRALGAFVLTAMLVVGVPLLLVVAVGNPFPSSIPSIDEIRILLTQNGQGFSNFLIGSLAILIWFIWAQLVVALAVEIVATVRNAETRRLRTAPGIQTLAARLIATMALATTLATAPVLAPAIGALSFDNFEPVASSSLQVNLDERGQIAPAEDDRAMAFVGAAQIQESTTLVLADQTELWDLAEAAYGDGVSWKLIAQANAGSVDASGAMVTDETEVLSAGTQVQLVGTIDAAAVEQFGDLDQVGDAAAVSEPSAIGETQATNTKEIARQQGLAQLEGSDGADALRVVEPGDSMWSLAEEVVETRLGEPASDAEVADYWVDVVDANQNVSSGDVDLIYPGEELTLPRAAAVLTDVDSAASQASETAETDEAADGGAQAAPQTTPFTGDFHDLPTPHNTPGSVPSEVPAGAAESIAAPATQNEQNESRPAVPIQHVGLAAFGMAMLSAGVVGAVRRRRDLQRRTRPLGSFARQPSTEAAAFEAALAHASQDLLASEQGSGWRLLPADAVASIRGAGPMEVHATPTGRLHAVSLADHGDAWEPRRVEMPADLQVAGVAQALQCPAEELVSVGSVEPGAAALPTTVVVGTDPATGDAVLVDLASADRLELRGDPNAVRSFARSAVLELAVSDRADDLCVIAVGVGHELADLERVRVVDSFSNALVQAVRCGHAGNDSDTPVVVVSAVEPDDGDQSIDALASLGACIITPGTDSQMRLTITGDQAKLWPSGTSVMLAALANDQYQAVAELIDVTDIDATEPVAVDFVASDALDVPVVTECMVEAGRVEVQVLGPVEVAGASPFSSIKAVDVVTYLAFNRNGVDADQIKTWVWPAFDPPTDKAFANVMSRARTGLGTTDDGTPYLSRAGADKTYRLTEQVTTDFDRFRAIVDLADAAAEPAQRLQHLRQALELIRGVPFTGGTATSYAWADNHVRAHVEFTIDEAVHQCADLALELDDLAAARWAALKGLELVPGCEQCFRRRFLVAGAGNNRTELRRAMADLERTAAAELGEPEAVDTISGDLLELYHELDRALVAGSA